MRNVLVHAHIFKNAGTTFDASLRRHFGDGFVDHREDTLFLQGGNAYLLDYLAGNPGVKALSSHSLHFRITGNGEFSLHPVYFLRHPLARVWSVYYFERRQTGVDTEGARRAKTLGLNDYVAWYLEEGSPATIRNVHTIFLSGEGPSPDNMDRKFSLARVCLDDPQTGIAVVERYDDSMLVLEHKLSQVFPGIDLSYRKKNVSPESRDVEMADAVDSLLSQLDDEVAEKLRAANAMDLMLYRQAGERLDQALAGISGLDAKRRDFMARCRALPE